jgi:predicted N-acetyltransferase YhbS
MQGSVQVIQAQLIGIPTERGHHFAPVVKRRKPQMPGQGDKLIRAVLRENHQKAASGFVVPNDFCYWVNPVGMHHAGI